MRRDISSTSSSHDENRLFQLAKTERKGKVKNHLIILDKFVVRYKLRVVGDSYQTLSHSISNKFKVLTNFLKLLSTPKLDRFFFFPQIEMFFFFVYFFFVYDVNLVSVV